MFRHIRKVGPKEERTEGGEDYYVNHRFRQHFRIEKGVLHCRGCYRALRNGVVYGRGSHGGYGAPALEHRFFHPHLCVLSVLKEVEALHKKGILVAALYDAWMACNGGEYQLGDGKECMRVWQEVVDANPPRPPVPFQWLKKLGTIPRYLSLVHCPKHGGFYVKIDWQRIGNDKESMHVFQRIWEYTSNADAAKTTVNAGNMIWHMRKCKFATDLYDKWASLFSVSLPNVTVTCMLIHVVANPEADTMFQILGALDMCCMHVESYQAVTKLVSVAIRRTAKFMDGKPASLDQVCLLAGWELATGRSLNKSDWVDEKRKRTEEVVYLGDPLLPTQTKESNAEYIAKLLPVVTSVLQPAVRPMKRKFSWLEHVENRQSWVSSGSTGGKHMRMADGSKLRMNKHAYFESITKEEMLTWLDSEPAVYATGSEKMEPGKKRAIYGSNPLDYSIHDYVIRKVEGTLSSVDGLESGLTGVDYVTSMIRRLHAVQEPGVEGTMIDYTDFNYQHTLEAQATVFEALGTLYEFHQYHPDLIRACEWTRRSFLNQHLKIPALGPGYTKVTQGMFSGVRPTNFINTVLNVSYFKLAEAWVKEKLDLVSEGLLNIHQGDDVWITNKSRLWAVALFNCMVASGLQFQGSKQMFDRGRGEFLRVMYTNTGCKAFAARAVASFVVKPIQSADVVSPLDRASSLSDHVAIMRRRGFTEEGCTVVWKATVPFAAQAKLGANTISVPTSMLLKHHRDNGLGIGAPGNAAARGKLVPPLPRMKLGSLELEKAVPTNMAKDWVAIVSRQMQRPLKSDDLVRVLHQANVTDSLRSCDRMNSLKAHLQDLGRWLAKNKPGPVVCNKAEFDKLLEGPRASEKVAAYLTEVCSKHTRKLSRERPGKLEMIEACVASSPFKSTSSTQIALGLNVIDAVIAAISLSNSTGMKEEALSFIQTIRTICGDEILRYLLDGPKTCAGSFLGMMHPLVLYWIQDRAVEEAVNAAICLRIRKLDALKDLVETTFLRHLRSAVEQPLLLQISSF